MHPGIILHASVLSGSVDAGMRAVLTKAWPCKPQWPQWPLATTIMTPAFSLRMLALDLSHPAAVHTNSQSDLSNHAAANIQQSACSSAAL